MFFRQIYDNKLAQYTYLIGCERTQEALVIDPERDIDRYVQAAEEEGFTITAVAETHIHADFLSGAREFAEHYGVTLYLSDEGGENWKYEWVKKGSYDVRLLHDGDTFHMGNVRIQAVHTPGHTPEHLSFLVTDTGAGADRPMGIVTGDFIFVGDVGRPDLLETAAGEMDTLRPSAQQLYRSIQKFLSLGEYLQIWPGHGAGSACGKALGSVPVTTVGYEARFSPAMEAARAGEDRFADYVLTDQPEPPAYFARMKTLNKQGPPVLGTRPRPERVTAAGLGELAGRTDVTVIDTRPDRMDFFRGHLSGSLYAPLDKHFPTVAGSYADPEKPIYLIAEPDEVEEAVRNLIRVGLDGVAGYITPDVVKAYGALRSTQVINFADVEQRRTDADTAVVDVRRADEFKAGHIPGAVHRPHTRLRLHLEDVPRDKTLLVHCASGLRSAAATALLERAGFDAVLVNDEFANWARAHERAPEAEAV